MSDKVTILCSGFGLGFYVPGLLINYNLKNKGIDSEVVVFENYIIKDKQDNISVNKQAYHKNFSVALIAQRMPWDIKESIDNDMIDQLLNDWEKEKRNNFIVMSGHWIYILDEYRKRLKNHPINAEIIYIDSEPSPSWKGLSKYNPKYSESYSEEFLFDAEKKVIKYYVPVSVEEPIPFSERENRFMIHGGGWGMGTYQEKIHELEESNLKLDIIAYKEEEVGDGKSGHKYFMMDPDWKAWNPSDENKFIFPPFAEVKCGVTPQFTSKKEYHSSFDVLRNAKAVISKPGGGTLIDSLAAATPIILLEPFGHHEKINSDLWEKLGLGIRYEKWKESGFKLDILEDMHKNLIKQRNSTTNYIDLYINNLMKSTESKVK